MHLSLNIVTLPRVRTIDSERRRVKKPPEPRILGDLGTCRVNLSQENEVEG